MCKAAPDPPHLAWKEPERGLPLFPPRAEKMKTVAASPLRLGWIAGTGGRPPPMDHSAKPARPTAPPGAADPAPAQASDVELLGRFCTDQDGAAFELLLRRHGGMVMALLRR